MPEKCDLLAALTSRPPVIPGDCFINSPPTAWNGDDISLSQGEVSRQLGVHRQSVRDGINRGENKEARRFLRRAGRKARVAARCYPVRCYRLRSPA